MNRIKIEYNEVIDLSCALLRYARRNRLSSERIAGYSVSRELSDWYAMAKASVPSLLDNDVCYMLGKFLGLTFLPVTAAVEQQSRDVAALLEFLSGLSAEELIARLYASYDSDIPFSEIEGRPELIKKAIEKAGGTTTVEEAELFADFVRNPVEFRDRLVEIMDKFYRYAIEPFKELYMPAVTAQIESDQSVLDEDPKRFFSGICRVNIDSFDASPIVLISFFSEIDIIQLNEPAVIIYGRCRSRFENVSEIPPDQIYSLFADESRRKILQMLCRKPRFIRELADELGITSATVSYHMSRLSSMNLVTYERGVRKRIYYRADVEKVKRMINTVETDILG